MSSGTADKYQYVLAGSTWPLFRMRNNGHYSEVAVMPSRDKEPLQLADFGLVRSA